VKRFQLYDANTRVIYPYEEETKLISPQKLEHLFPLTFDYFLKTREVLDKRDRGSAKGENWYVYIRRQNIALQPLPKIAVPRLVRRLVAAYDADGEFCLDNVDVGGITLRNKSKENYLFCLGLLNSKLLNFYFLKNAAPFRGGFFSANRQYIEQLPIRAINFADAADKARHDNMVKLVERMLDLHKQLAKARTSGDQTSIQRQITATDRQIDRLVYELYDLSEAEIAIIETP
jgi:hypothetical protein